MVELEMYLLCLHQPVLFSAALWHDIRICVDFDWEYVDVWSADCAISLLWRGGSEYVDARAYSDDGASSGAGGYRAVDDATSAISVYEQCSSDECDHIYSGAGIVLWEIRFWCMDMRWRAGIILTVCIRRMRCLTTAFGIPYLICLIVGLVGCGYGIIRKRNIIW